MGWLLDLDQCRWVVCMRFWVFVEVFPKFYGLRRDDNIVVVGVCELCWVVLPRCAVVMSGSGF